MCGGCGIAGRRISLPRPKASVTPNPNSVVSQSQLRGNGDHGIGLRTTLQWPPMRGGPWLDLCHTMAAKYWVEDGEPKPHCAEEYEDSTGPYAGTGLISSETAPDGQLVQAASPNSFKMLTSGKCISA